MAENKPHTLDLHTAPATSIAPPPMVHRLSHVSEPDRHVIILPGLRTSHAVRHANESAAGMIRRLTNLLTPQTTADIRCLIYSEHPSAAYTQGHFEQSNTPATSPETMADAHAFVKDVLLQQMGLTQTHTPDVPEACSNLAKLTLVAHSFGTRFAVESARIFRETLAEHGYETDAIKQITREIVCINLASACRTDILDGYRTISFGADDDPTVCGVIARCTPQKPLRDAYYQAAGYAPLKNTVPLDSLSAKKSANGIDIRATLPERIEWIENGRLHHIDQERLNHEFVKTQEISGGLLDTHGAALINNDVVPQHDPRMFLVHTDKNQHLVNAVTTALNGAINREPTGKHTWRADLAALLPASLRSIRR